MTLSSATFGLANFSFSSSSNSIDSFFSAPTHQCLDNSYSYLTRYLDVEKTLFSQSITPYEESVFLRDIEAANWNGEAFQNAEKFPYVGLKLLKENKIHFSSYVDSLLYWMMRERHPATDIEVLNLFDENGNLNENLNNAITTSIIPFYNEGEKSDYLDRLKKLPKTASTFFTVPENLEDYGDLEDYALPTLTRRFTQIHFYRLHDTVYRSSGLKRTFPSLEMMQEYLNVKFGENAVQFRPTIGLSTLEDIKKNGLTQSRDMGVSFPGVLLPKSVDTYRCEKGYHFSYHDFYHAVVASHISHEEQLKIIALSNIVNSTDLKHSSCSDVSVNDFKKEVISNLVDMEHRIYELNPYEGISTPDLYIYVLYSAIQSAFELQTRKKLQVMQGKKYLLSVSKEYDSFCQAATYLTGCFDIFNSVKKIAANFLASFQKFETTESELCYRVSNVAKKIQKKAQKDKYTLFCDRFSLLTAIENLCEEKNLYRTLSGLFFRFLPEL